MNDHIHEMHLVDLNDEELKNVLGATYHGLKNLDEQQRHDPEIARLQDLIREYRAEKYTDAIRALKARLKGARALALARGIHWTVPEPK